MNPVEMYKLYEEGLSLHQIAEKYNTYPNKIKRLLNKHGYQLRNKSDAQKASYDGGRPHPRAGKNIPEEMKEKIARTLSETWQNMPEKDKKRRSKLAKNAYNSMSDQEKTELLKKAHEGMREAAKHGSRMEKFVSDALSEAGYNVERHRTGITMDRDLEVDIYLPSVSIVIEIDGPTHFLPIFGEEKLQKHIEADNAKNAILLNHGLVVIRVKCYQKNISNFRLKETAKSVLEFVTKIADNFPDRKNRLIEIEVGKDV